ncbi:YkvA family protein [Allorhizocola rhizosphaerae]|uniref:YkvA family protein n=1 Tax=Allorhizocola rhizosphaerae TaxID=1872709 RepID=UPI000E3DD764|nr:YkvA family protein [Allorhizocola rhizosphaerae]
MASTMRRAAAFSALWKALTSRGGAPIGRRLGAMPRMFWHTLTGRYDGAGRLFLIAAGAAYVLSPIDLLPEMVLLLPGLLDDAFIVTWVAGALLDETDRFLRWEQARQGGVVIDGEVA